MNALNLTDAQLRELYDDCETHLHRMKDGSRISLSKMTAGHLENTIKLYEGKAQEGVVFATMVRSFDWDSLEEYFETFYGAEALKALDYDLYVAERLRRQETNEAPL